MERFALPAARRVFESLKTGDDSPTIYFAPGAGGSLPAQAECGSTALGLDWRVDLAEVRAEFPGRMLQGNLDPGVVLGSRRAIEEGVRQVLEAAGTSFAHVFNLGHGFLPETPVDHAEFLVKTVHDISVEMRRE
jgi:uroporphyrinogen decarboxylase